MNCCFHEWEKTKLEIKLLVRRGLSPNMGPESCLKGFILQTVIIEKRDLRLGKRTFLSLYSKHFNDFVELLMEFKHCVRGFFTGSGKHLTCICNRWFVTPCDWSLVPIGLCSGWNWDERTLLMELKRLHEVSHSKYLKGLGMSKCGLGTMTLWSKWTVGPTSSARKVAIRCRAWDLESSVSREQGVFFFAKY